MNEIIPLKLNYNRYSIASKLLIETLIYAGLLQALEELQSKKETLKKLYHSTAHIIPCKVMGCISWNRKYDHKTDFNDTILVISCNLTFLGIKKKNLPPFWYKFIHWIRVTRFLFEFIQAVRGIFSSHRPLNISLETMLITASMLTLCIRSHTTRWQSDGHPVS